MKFRLQQRTNDREVVPAKRENANLPSTFYLEDEPFPFLSSSETCS